MFILEWIAHQRLCGFRTVIVVTNDCTDGTDAICDEIASVDPDFIHMRNELSPGDAPQIKGMELVFKLPIMCDIDYLLHCDADEFLNIDTGEGQVGDLIDATGAPDCIALAWRPFGDAGNMQWTGGLVTEKCTRAAGVLRPSFTVHKSMFRPSQFEHATDHMPKSPISKAVKVVNARGQQMPAKSMFHPRHARYRGTPPTLFTWENACIFHYAIRSQDVFLMKNRRGDGMARETQRYFLNSRFWRRNNKNNVVVSVAPDRLSKLKTRVEKLRCIGQITDIENRAIAQFREVSQAYLTPSTIDALTLK